MSFLQSVERSFEEIIGRTQNRDGLLHFGIKFLDDAMVGIMRNDLILIGAGSGGGKTQTCVNIALANVEAGKKVHYIALEAEYEEIERRIKYQLFARHFFNDPKRPKDIHISFRNWMLGDFVRSCDYAEATATSEFMNRFPTLFTYYKSGGDFTIDDMIRTITYASDDTDLIILDHVHYMDYDDDNENRAIKQIAKTARTLALEMGKPIILVSHLRKGSGKTLTFAPGLEEFHGSSDLYKIATKAITIGPGGVSSDGKIQTYFRIVKDRFDGSLTRYIGKVSYNPKLGSYEKSYYLGDAYQSASGSFQQLIQDYYPAWAEYSLGPNSNPPVPPRK